MKRRYIRIVIAGIIFLLALLLTLYPVISNLYRRIQRRLADSCISNDKCSHR